MKTLLHILGALLWMTIILIIWFSISSCAHTKKAFAELSKKVDSTFVSRKDTAYRNKKDSSNTVVDLHGIDIFLPDETPYEGVDPNTINPADYFPPEELKRIKELYQKPTDKIQIITGKGTWIHIDSAKVAHGQIVTTTSGKSSKVDSSHKITEEHSKTKTVDRKGTNAMGTILIWASVLGLIIFLVFKFKSKIPFIKNLW